MGSQADAPEQIIRRWLERNGTARVGASAIAETWALAALVRRD